MNFLRRIHALVVKELQSVLGDPSSRALLIMPVLLQTLLFPFAATLDVNNASLAIYNRDSGTASNELMQRFASSAAFTEIHAVRGQHEMEDLIERRVVIAGCTPVRIAYCSAGRPNASHPIGCSTLSPRIRRKRQMMSVAVYPSGCPTCSPSAEGYGNMSRQ